MNSTSITDYILKLEKLNEESRTKIEQLKKLLNEANEEKVAALNMLNDVRGPDKNINVVNDKNADVVEYLNNLSNQMKDRFKSIAYRRGAEVIADLPYEVLSGESLLHLKGIGKSIASKIDEFLEEQDSDYEESDQESVASNEGQLIEESEYDTDSEESVVSDSHEYIVSFNAGLADMLYECADKATDNFRHHAYIKAADLIYELPYKITNVKEAMKLPGVGKSIARKIDSYLNINKKLTDCFIKLGNLEDNMFKSEAYWTAGEKLRKLNCEVKSSKDVKNIKGFGPSICDKIDEFMETGKMKRIEELSS
jgi:DNA polymerase/3'-5' exonuclease PolX